MAALCLVTAKEKAQPVHEVPRLYWEDKVMIAGQNYKPEQDFALLLVGPPLSGKTTVAMQLPDPCILSTDRKLRNAVSRIKPGAKWWYEYVEMTPGPGPTAWERFVAQTKKAATEPDVKSIIWDNLTDLGAILMEHILFKDPPKLQVGGEKVPEKQHWQPFRDLMRKAIAVMRSSGKLFCVCAHEMVDSDDMSGSLLYRPLIGGQLKDNVGGYFTDVWRCETKLNAQGGVTYYVRTQPMPRMALGNTLGLPKEFEFTQEDFLKRLSEVQHAGGPTPAGPK